MAKNGHLQQKLGVVALPYTSWHSEEEREEAQVSRDQPKLVTRSLAQLILAAIWPKVLVGHQCLLTFLLRVPRSPDATLLRSPASSECPSFRTVWKVFALTGKF